MAAVSTSYGISGSTVIGENRNHVFDVVQAAYCLHACGDAVKLDSYLLRHPVKPGARIITLPPAHHLRSRTVPSARLCVGTRQLNIADRLPQQANAILRVQP